MNNETSIKGVLAVLLLLITVGCGMPFKSKEEIFIMDTTKEGYCERIWKYEMGQCTKENTKYLCKALVSIVMRNNSDCDVNILEQNSYLEID